MTKDYCQGIEYKDGKVEAVYGQEGRLTAVYDEYGVTLTRFRAEYGLKDHLGNTSIAFADENHNGVIEVWDDPSTPENEAEITQENHYYPFGMNQEGPWYATIGPRNGYQYNGKELNEELDLDWNDYGARWQDPATGRWWQVDPLAENYAQWSVYAYTFNNPILFIDPDGRAPAQPKDDYYDRKGNFLFRDSKKTDFIRIVDDKALNNAYPQILSHNPGAERSQFLEDYFGQNSKIVSETKISVEAWSKITTDILSKMEDVDASMLYNGSTSVIDRITGDKFNDPENVASLANTVVTKDGSIKITSTLYGGSADVHLSTVSNVQNVIGAHEFQGHGIKGLGDKTKTHHKAYEHQFKHPSYKTITHSLRSELQSNYKYYLNREKN